MTNITRQQYYTARNCGEMLKKMLANNDCNTVAKEILKIYPKDIVEYVLAATVLRGTSPIGSLPYSEEVVGWANTYEDFLGYIVSVRIAINYVSNVKIESLIKIIFKNELSKNLVVKENKKC